MRINSLLFFVLTSVLFLFSCERDDSYPKTFQKCRFENGDVQFYSAGGLVSDQNKMNSFILRVQDAFSILDYIPSLDSNFVEYDNSDFTIEMLSSTKARFALGNGDTRDYKVSRKNGVIYFIQDSTAYTLGDFYEYWFKFKPDIVRIELLPFGQKTYFKPTIFAYDVDGEIQFPFISIMALYNYGYTCFERHNNSINEALLAEITQATSARDTIAFRESRVVFSEK